MTHSRASFVTHNSRLITTNNYFGGVFVKAGRNIVFTYLDFSEVIGGATAACARLPTAPAVYAFFRNIKLPHAGSANDFLTAVIEAITAHAAPNRTSKVGPLHKVTLECYSELSSNKAEALTLLAQSVPFRAFLSKIAETASLLQSPLYVGKAESLQSRIRQHLDPMSDLAVRLREADIKISGCTLVYTIVDESAVSLDGSTMTLIEEIISRLCRPGFVSRIG
jgi:hypothetical protein